MYRSEYPGRESYAVTRVLSLGDNGPAGALVRSYILETFERKRFVDATDSGETLVFNVLQERVQFWRSTICTFQIYTEKMVLLWYLKI